LQISLGENITQVTKLLIASFYINISI